MSDIFKKSVLLNEFNFVISNLKHFGQKNKSLKDLLAPFIKELEDSIKSLKSSGDIVIELEHLHTFFEIIKCEDLDGIITALALKSIHKIILYNLIDVHQNKADEITLGIIESITKARFLSSTTTSDEVVLLEILNVLKILIESPLNKYINDGSMLEFMQSCFRICFELRLSEVLRRTAELVLIQFSIILFNSSQNFAVNDKFKGKDILKKLNREDTVQNAKGSIRRNASSRLLKQNTVAIKKSVKGNYKDFIDDSALQDSIYSKSSKKRMHKLNSNKLNPTSTLSPGTTHTRTASFDDLVSSHSLHTLHNNSDQNISKSSHNTSDCPQCHFYGIQCVNEYFRFIVSLTDPFNKYNKREFLELGLSLLTVCFEIGITNIKNTDYIMNLIKEDLCRNIYEIFHHDSLILFTIGLNIFSMLFLELRSVIKYQLEHLFVVLLDMCSVESTKVSSEKKEIIYDFLLKITEDELLLNEIFINFDAQPTSVNIFERFVNVLTNVVSAPQPSSKALHAFLSIIFSIDNEAQHAFLPDSELSSSDAWDSNNTKMEERVLQSLKLKPLYNEGIEILNSSLSKGIQHFQQHKIFPEKDFESYLAEIFKYDLRVSKKLVGESIGNRKYPKLLMAYINCFDMKNVRIDEALRSFLESFRIPGESPVISLILESFSSYYFSENPNSFNTKDAIFTLTYAIIMLNVDQHNTNVKMQKSMVLEDFVNNLKGQNGGKDYSFDLLKEIFHSIRQSEIIVPSERAGAIKQSYMWKLTLEKSRKVPYEYYTLNHIILRKYMFKTICVPALSCLFVFLSSPLDFSTTQKVLFSFRILTKLSSVYHFYSTIDKIVIQLLKYSNMVRSVDQIRLDPDLVILELGGNTHGQMCLTSCFKIIHNHADCLHLSWKYILAAISNFCSAELLEINMYEFEDFVNTSGRFFLKTGKKIALMPNSDNISSGFINSFVQLIITNPDVNENQIADNAFKIAQKVVSHCQVGIFLNETKTIQNNSFLEFYKCLIQFSSTEIYKIPFDAESNTSSDIIYLISPSTATFFLESLITVALYNKHRIDLFIVELIEKIYQLTVKATQLTILNERAVVGLLRLCIRLMDLPTSTPNKLMVTVRSLVLNLPLIVKCSNTLTYGLHELIKTCFLLITSGWDWVCILEILEIAGAGRHSVLTSISIHPEIVNKALIDQDTVSTLDQNLLRDIHMSEIYQQKALYDAIDDGGRDELAYKSNSSFAKFNPLAFYKTIQTLIFLIKEQPCHLSHLNILPCVHILSTFSERLHIFSRRNIHDKTLTRDRRNVTALKQPQENMNDLENERIDEQEIAENINIVLELMYILIGKSSTVLLQYMQTLETQSLSKNECSSFLWYSCWSQLLKRIAMFVTDPARNIRLSSLHFLQRALLIDDLQVMSVSEWYMCFDKILFPMLRILLMDISHIDISELDETKVRVLTLFSKIFLQNLHELANSESFPKLWMRILQALEKYKNSKSTDVLQEAIPEYVKNILLVMTTGGVLNIHSPSPQSLWNETNSKIKSFLPDFNLDFLYLANPSSMTIPSPIDTDSNHISSNDNENINTNTNESNSPSNSTLFNTHSILPLDMPNFKIITTPSTKL